jgi:hypothetical protein
MSTMLEDVAENVYDQNLYTKWSANCRVLLGGCPPLIEYVGQSTEGFVPVNFDKYSPYANVRCVKLYQSENVTKTAAEVALVTWLNETDFLEDQKLVTGDAPVTKRFHIVNTFHSLMPGIWQKRPAMEHGLWRLWNMQPTERPWRVAGIMFYSDMFCTMEEKGVVISSTPYPPAGCLDTRSCDLYNATQAVDSVYEPGLILPNPLPSYWMAECHWWNGCIKEAGWIGLDFGQFPRTIRCIRIFQPTNPSYPLVGPTSHATEIKMQTWDGFKWLDNSYFAGLGMGGWNDTRPLHKAAWRISNLYKVPKTWIVYELGFYQDVECGTRLYDGSAKEPIIGIPISANPLQSFAEQIQTCRLQSGSCAELAFDTDTATSWVSSCDYCLQHEAWIGNRFTTIGGQEVKCFRLWQSGELDHQSESIELSYWNGDTWILSRSEIGLGGGTWNFRPAQVNSMFRVLSNSITEEPWTLIGFQMYNDTECLTKMEGGPIVSGSKLLNPVTGAFDEDDYTYWEAGCPPPARSQGLCLEFSMGWHPKLQGPYCCEMSSHPTASSASSTGHQCEIAAMERNGMVGFRHISRAFP